MRLQVARLCHKMRKVSAQLLLSQRFVDQLPGLECHLSLIAVIITFIAAFLHKHSHTHTHNNWAYSSVCCIICLPLFPFTFRNSPHSFFIFWGAAVVRDNFSTAQNIFITSLFSMAFTSSPIFSGCCCCCSQAKYLFQDLHLAALSLMLFSPCCS